MFDGFWPLFYSSLSSPVLNRRIQEDLRSIVSAYVASRPYTRVLSNAVPTILLSSPYLFNSVNQPFQAPSLHPAHFYVEASTQLGNEVNTGSFDPSGPI